MLLPQKFQNSALCDTTDTSTSVVHTTGRELQNSVLSESLQRKDVHTNIHKTSSLVLKV